MFLWAVSPLRRVGMGLALAGVILQAGAEWVLSTVAFPGGFPFGVAFIAVLGIALSVAATIVLITSLGQARREANGTLHRRWVPSTPSARPAARSGSATSCPGSV